MPVDFGPAGSSVRSGEVYGAKVRMVLTEVGFLSIIIKAVVDVGNTFSFTKTLRNTPFQVVNDSNIQYLNPDDDDEPGVQLYVTQVFIYFHN